MLLSNIYNKVPAAKIFTGLVIFGCNLSLFSTILGSRGSVEFALNITAFALVLAISCLFAWSLYKYVQGHEKFWALVEELTETNEHMDQMEKQKKEMLAILTDKLKNPLQLIHGYSSMLLDGTFGMTEGKIHEVADKIFSLSDVMNKAAEGLDKMTADATATASATTNTQQNNYQKIKTLALRVFAVIAVGALLLQVLLAPTALNLFVRTLIAIITVLLCFFLANEVKHEPDSEKTESNLLHDLSVSREHVAALESGKSQLLSRISNDFRASLTQIIDNASGLSQGTFGEISETTNEGVGKILESSKELLATFSELTSILAPQEQK